MEQNSHKGLKRLFIVLGILVAVIVIMFLVMGRTMGKDLHSLVFEPVDMNQVADGTYQGTTETTLVKVDVEVTVQDHKITNVKLLRHDNGKGKNAEVLPDVMVSENTYDVDDVSGATASSEVIKNAVNKALVKGMK